MQVLSYNLKLYLSYLFFFIYHQGTNEMKKYFKGRVAITNEHGSWVFLFSPLLIGLFAGGEWSIVSLYLILAALAGFLIRQPITLWVKMYSGRRSQRDLPAARFWTIVYGLLGGIMILGLVLRGYGFVLYLAIPAIPVFGWHLYLVRKRAERGKMGVEIVASGVLALAAPAAYWVGMEGPDPRGWWLWALTWFQSAASIVYAYLRLEQRPLEKTPAMPTRFRMGRRALLYTTFNLAAVVSFSWGGFLPPWLFVPYLLQWLETLWGISHPATGWKPTKIGFRQLFVSSVFTFLFIVTWRFI
ncbi:MAG: hypothetical protein MAG431_02517 [Chloroflexi bacterium]|nr:hypothetical protein [Chloroflexota bacterium]